MFLIYIIRNNYIYRYNYVLYKITIFGIALLKIDIQKTKNIIIKDLQKQIPELINNEYNFRITQLPSKQNSVVRLIFNKKPLKLPREFIIKIFRTRKIVSEINILKRLANQKIQVPKIILFKKPYLVLKKINGVNLSDFINKNLIGVKELKDLNSNMINKVTLSIEKLAEWFAFFHEKNIVRKKEVPEILVLNKGNNRLRDFIIDFSKNILYGTDFEESYEGNHLDDLAWICCSLLDTNPGIFEIGDPKQKIELINIFLKKYYQKTSSLQFDFNYLAEKIIEDLNIVIKRRGKSYKLSKSKFIEKISKAF